MRRLIDISQAAAKLLEDLLIAIGIWVVLTLILISVFPGEPNPDVTTSRWWWIFVALAVAAVFTIFRRRRRKSKQSSDEGPMESELSAPGEVSMLASYATAPSGDHGAAEPSENYQAATVLLQLGAAVSAADGTISSDEERLLEAHLEESLHLPQADRTRLRAYLQWLLLEPPALTRMTSRLRGLSDAERRQVARFAITIAGADGGVSSDEVKVLNRVYNLLGLEADQLHRDIHDLASAPPTQPVTVLQPDEPAGHRIPAPPPPALSAQGRDSDVVELDREKIVAIMKDTREVTDLLTSIFEGPTEPEPAEQDQQDTQVEEQAAAAANIAGGLLDPAHAELVRFLATRPKWPRSEFEAASSKLGLMPAGAIETINNAAFEHCDEPLIEGTDPLDMNEFALHELQELLDAS